MVCKPINQINFNLEEMYDAIFWLFMTVRQASVFDANNFCHHISQLTQNFCHHISQLTQLISGNIPHPERFNQMIYIEQGEESHKYRSSASKGGFPKDHLQLARNVLNQLLVKFPANSNAPCNEAWKLAGTLGTEHLD